MAIKAEYDSAGEISSEKREVAHVSGPGSLECGEAGTYDGAATTRLLRKLDWHIVPFLSLLYLYATLRAHSNSS